MTDMQLASWVTAIPYECRLIISMLGTKPGGLNEWSFYSFDGKGSTFQEWLDGEFPALGFMVLNRPTVDLRPVPESICKTILGDIQTCAEKFRTTAILIDSGGVTRTGIACRWMKAKERSDR
ncbi:hypothetical protein EOC93_08690 [Mesorhizobium sp. M6A.T.Ce.TU.002.03.1.1]|uniref:hypothetical protein n=1 Tax=Mesorhizobium sp. M6A.T.Ce.TU.002.03.1.1 TaxID=2496782 RepID=UPI000FCAA635|nr:hypothetical protein [Mesorhizobium sp. M6A.T.Ce.TU.002.03.1.1]RUU44998.1 hypothetical protein EOC93_08690 [Mesorhizobium sp. M6A.T.Ce.TU.002.03.1.1]